MRRTPEQMTARARTLRNTQTQAERLIWRRLSRYRPRFTRQLVVGPYIIDLACRSARLAVEFDGSQHLAAEEYDGRRSDYFAREGWTVLHFWNNEVLDNPDGVAEAILTKADECLGGTHPQPLPSREGRRDGALPSRDGRWKKRRRVTLRLRIHPDTPHDDVADISVEIERAGSLVRCRFAVECRASGLVWTNDPPGRADELWRHTCFELFVKGAGDGYLEFNFAPSRQWAAYRFDRYREGMRDAEIEPLLAVDMQENRFALNAEVDLADVSVTALGLSAVIETRGGSKSYWALAHPPGKPDFHHPDCFALKLPAAGEP